MQSVCWRSHSDGKHVIIFFCVPFVYLLLGSLDDSLSIFGGILFLHTGTIIGICRRLEIPEGRVLLYCSYYMLTPCMVGVLKPRVFLPEEMYTEKEREIFFLHELTHYQQKDLWLKGIIVVILCIYWFNPLVYRYRRMVEIWSEYMCDYRASSKTTKVIDYMKVLGNAAMKEKHKPIKMGSMLIEDEGGVMKRLYRLKEYPNMKKRPGIQAAAVCLALCLLSSTTVLV